MKEKRDPETYAIIGAAMAVHSRLGSGFLEAVYHEALGIEFEMCGVPFKSKVPLSIRYRDRVLTATYRTDFICFDSVIIELKALSKLTNLHMGQTIHYLKSTGMTKAVLLDFGAPSLEYERIVFNHSS